MTSVESEAVPRLPDSTFTPIRVWLRLLRHRLRLLAPSSVIWIIGLVTMPMLIVGVWIDTFPTEAERMALARSVEGNPAFEAMFGRATALHTIEGFTMWRAGGPLIPAIIIWGMVAATRIGRGEEDKGHDELLLGGVLSRTALLTATLSALAITIAIFALLTGLMLPAISEISFAGSWRFALGMTCGFTLFASLGMLLSQLTPNRSIALRTGLSLTGVALGLRILSVIEQTPTWLTWTTPFGWFSELGTPDIGSNMPFVLFGIGTISFASASIWLAARRDLHGSTLVRERESVAVHEQYESLWAHEFHQQLPNIVGYSAVGLLLSTIFGMVTADFTAFIVDFPAFAQFLGEFGLTDPSDPAAYIGLVSSILVLVVTLYAAGHVASVRETEASGQLAILLTLPLKRQRWLTITITIGLAAIIVISLLIGFGAMLGTALTGQMLDPVDAIRTGLNFVPIALLFTGLGILIFGVYPPLTGPVVYATMLTSFLMVLIDAFLDIPGWIISLSPFAYLALVPAENANLLAAAVFVLIGAVGCTGGLLAFRRRDLMMN